MEQFVLLDDNGHKIDECWSDSVLNAEQIFIKKGHNDSNISSNVMSEADYYLDALAGSIPDPSYE